MHVIGIKIWAMKILLLSPHFVNNKGQKSVSNFHRVKTVNFYFLILAIYQQELTLGYSCFSRICDRFYAETNYILIVDLVSDLQQIRSTILICLTS